MFSKPFLNSLKYILSISYKGTRFNRKKNNILIWIRAWVHCAHKDRNIFIRWENVFIWISRLNEHSIRLVRAHILVLLTARSYRDFCRIFLGVSLWSLRVWRDWARSWRWWRSWTRWRWKTWWAADGRRRAQSSATPTGSAPVGRPVWCLVCISLQMIFT